jgi:small-conductance mechanosensitive channel
MSPLTHSQSILRLPQLVFAFSLTFASGALPQSTPSEKPLVKEASIRFWNRTIAMQRAIVAEAGPELRAERASARLSELPLSARSQDIAVRQFQIESQNGVGFLYQDRFLFFIGTNDLDQESGESLDSAAQSALANLKDALQARADERSWPVVRKGLLFTSASFLLLILACFAVWKLQAFLGRFFQAREDLPSLRLFRIDFFPHVAATAHAMFRALASVFTFSLVYLWVALSLRHFPYTEPWGIQANGFVFSSIQQLGSTILDSLPGLLIVVLIFVLVRWLLRMLNLVFDQIISQKARVAWMDADVARATQRILSAALWIFAIIVAYPYIPGSDTEAFKGLSVFFGLIISLGSTGIINQIMSGLFVVYSRALKAGEWVRINDIEGEVTDVGLLAAKIRTIEGKEITVPNSVLVTTLTTNFTRLGHPDGKTLSCTITVGYDVPWRQVHALLEMAADRTSNIRKEPKPTVIQRQLSDFYVEYTLVTRLNIEKLRVKSTSDLYSQILDAFNEFGVQIMSPHFMVQPNSSVVVPSSKWHSPPATPAQGPVLRNYADGP